jgi:glycosyltransferase involved in cell wall biosynthesis
LKVLWLHNHKQVWCGESAAAEREARLLARVPGVSVVQESADNAAITDMSFFAKLALPLRNAWSHASYRRVRELCRQHKPDVVHAHNVWPLLSPAVLAAARREGVPTVFTAHNFYLFCLNGVFFRDGKVCTDCKGGLPWQGVRHRCYRGIAGSTTRFFGTAMHRALRTFHRVNRILVPTEFSRRQFLDAGFDAGQVQTKWLSCEDPLHGHTAAPAVGSGTPLFIVACRLVPEKGVHILIEACRNAQTPWQLQIAGDGPLRPRLQELARGLEDRVEFLGQVTPARLQERMAFSTAVLLPSIWFETFGLTAIEAFAAGRPVIASAIGALNEVVDDQSGLRVPAGDARAWAIAMDRLATDRALAAQLGNGARARYLHYFTQERDAERLLGVYRDLCPHV